MKKIGRVSLGCLKNTVDTEGLLGDLAAHGCEITAREEDVEVMIVNICGLIM
ncbi:MAG: hypothetical protein IIA62_02605 [Nitrospinae bacterium]|nr:hypothetical protein [Nitrospinota bacterium]